MDTRQRTELSKQPVIRPTDVIVGLGSVDRQLLATCVALFEDGALRHRLMEWVDKGKRTAGELIAHWQKQAVDAQAGQEVVDSIHSGAEQWANSRLSDAELRVKLWACLQRAVDSAPRTCVSTRAANRLGDSLTAALLTEIGPGIWEKLKGKLNKDPAVNPMTLDALARDTLQTMLQHTLDSDHDSAESARAQLIAAMRGRIQQLDEEDRLAILNEVGADKLNDQAVRNIILLGGGLTAFSSSVGIAGFSGYILAAQASAFIPLITGPALVSLVSVVSNPLTVIALTAGGGWWAARRVQGKVNVAIASQVVALLAMNGLISGPQGARNLAAAFMEVFTSGRTAGLDEKTLTRYKTDWQTLRAAWTQCGEALPTTLSKRFDQPIVGRPSERFGKFFDVNKKELRDAAAVSLLTLGDIVYHACAIKPTVMKSADFARLDNLNDTANFAAFADHVEGLSGTAYAGEISDIKGYVAERVVASQLVEQGHQVSFPDTSNQPGWDIMVDGVKAQIKDTNNLDYLARHFEHYGGRYPVIVNTEMAEKLADHHEAWTDQVYYVDGYSNAVVQHVTESSIEAGASIDHPHVPAFTMIVTAVRSYQRYSQNQATISQAVEQVLITGSTKMTLATAGGMVGASLGMVAFGPAGALVFGGVVPIISQMQSSRVQAAFDKHLTSERYRKWAERTQQKLYVLHERCTTALTDKRRVLEALVVKLPEGLVSDYLRWRFQDDLTNQRECQCRLDSWANRQGNVELAVQNTMQWLNESTIHPAVYQDALKDLAVLLDSRPSITERTEEHAFTALSFVANHASRVTTAAQKWLGKNKKS